MSNKELAAEIERLRNEVAMLRAELATRPIIVSVPAQQYPQWGPSWTSPTITCGTPNTSGPGTVTLRSVS